MPSRPHEEGQTGEGASSPKSSTWWWVGLGTVFLLTIPGWWHFSTVTGEPNANFTFIKIADTKDGPFRSFKPSPGIDNHGRVIFLAELGEGNQGIFIGDGTSLKPMVDTKGEFKKFLGQPTMSDNGKVVFQAELDSGIYGYFRGPNPTTDVIYDNQIFDEVGDIAINNAGTMAFKAKILEERDWRKRMFRGNGGPPIEVLKSAHSHVGPPSLNNQGQVTFSVGDRVFLSSALAGTVPLVDKGYPYFLFNRPVINDAGVVLMQAALKDNEHKVEKHILSLQEGHLTTIVSSNGPFLDFFSLHAINNQGGLVFNALLESGEVAMFTGPDPVSHKVIGSEDGLFGERIAEDGGPIISAHSLNDKGQIAFFARLENGTEGIYRVDPILPPQPAIQISPVGLEPNP